MINIVVPMAGKGSRFAEKGYAFPKPLIEVKKMPMIQVVINNLKLKRPHRFVFICQREHYDKYSLKTVLNNLAPGCEIKIIDGVTEGAVCTVLLAKEYFDNDDELIIANSDQFVDMDINEFVMDAEKTGTDGSILTFPAYHPKWSYAKTDETGQVVEVAEKNPISNNATVGIYYFKKGREFVKAAQQMIMKNIRVNNEFYVCPVYNEIIGNKLKVKIYPIKADQMHGLGTPEDLEAFFRTDVIKRL
ncbi:glycosyltransferase family 2 protein [Candidatus Micrarchaeota archaeon]|nr:glycosyltransferase family 2 protein [Candidatus Micrarchaeota archaeon]